MKQYLELLQHVLDKGQSKQSRGLYPLKSTFGYQMRFDLRKGFPIVTTKRMPFRTMTRELLWFISGESNIKSLQKYKIKYWDKLADEKGDLGPVYGAQWRHWPDYQQGEVDQLQNVIDEIKNTPDSKAMTVNAWNPAQTKDMRLPPCHMMFQFNVTKGKLRMQLYQRSADVFLGVPFNISQYALLLIMVAHVCQLKPREFIHTIGDAHIYTNHIEPAKEQLERKPLRLPLVKIKKRIKSIDDFHIDDFELVNYQHHPHIPADLVVV